MDHLKSLPYDLCNHYGYCDANGICRVNKDPICDCLKGFTPISQEEWDFRNWSKGCVRKTPLDCHKGDGFVKLDGLKLPDLLQFWLNKSMSLEECKVECLKNCSCVAYTNSDVREGGSGCLIWFGQLIDVRELRVKGSEQDVYLRLSASEISKFNLCFLTQMFKNFSLSKKDQDFLLYFLYHESFIDCAYSIVISELMIDVLIL